LSPVRRNDGEGGAGKMEGGQRAEGEGSEGDGRCSVRREADEGWTEGKRGKGGMQSRATDLLARHAHEREGKQNVPRILRVRLESCRGKAVNSTSLDSTRWGSERTFAVRRRLLCRAGRGQLPPVEPLNGRAHPQSCLLSPPTRSEMRSSSRGRPSFEVTWGEVRSIADSEGALANSV
jgi:hypothetical protein